MAFNEKLLLSHSCNHDGNCRIKVATELDAGKMIAPLSLARIFLITASDTTTVSIIG